MLDYLILISTLELIKFPFYTKIYAWLKTGKKCRKKAWRKHSKSLTFEWDFWEFKHLSSSGVEREREKEIKMVIGVIWVIWWLNFEQFIPPPPTYSLSCIVSTIIVIREFTEESFSPEGYFSILAFPSFSFTFSSPPRIIIVVVVVVVASRFL